MNNSQSQSKVLFTFNEYVTPTEVEEILGLDDDGSVVIDQIFISIPNKTGRGIIAGNGTIDIQSTIEAEMDKLIIYSERKGDHISIF